MAQTPARFLIVDGRRIYDLADTLWWSNFISLTEGIRSLRPLDTGARRYRRPRAERTPIGAEDVGLPDNGTGPRGVGAATIAQGAVMAPIIIADRDTMYHSDHHPRARIPAPNDYVGQNRFRSR